ncbi:hypothetical protein CLU79DRAFT_121511 [Phycomyces nitens]|nr:hypothetical protein CLU79DRAFT_121511 [Phycomyces nitens]
MNRISEEGTDVVEDFARQLEAVCLNSRNDHDNGAMDLDSDDNSDNDMDAPFGYEQIPQDDQGYGQLESEDEEEDHAQRDTIETIKEELAQVKAPTLVLGKSDQVPEDTLALIKSIMGNIELSKDAMPDWAKSIPESAWLPQIKRDYKEDC